MVSRSATKDLSITKLVLFEELPGRYSNRYSRGQTSRMKVPARPRDFASAAGASALGIILTGMGNNGAFGMLDMKRAGSSTIAQDEKSCVVFGMPKEAIPAGAVDTVAPLTSIPNLIMAWASTGFVKAVMEKTRY
ncbi:MAG TPA: chemotaxis protein CheB [Candidatus Angelobacter sp.]|jgi:chemotaxis response regulator CheB